jgi:NTP pyrophosphatase (non-canonical NTP hydrolase)
MTYCIYHIPGVKIGVTNNIKHRVEKQQGYKEDEYEILEMSDDINYVSIKELELQKQYGYSVDEELYSKLKCNKMKINVTEMTTTFPCPVNKLKGRLIDNIGMSWDTPFGECVITSKSVEWIMDNVCSSKYTNDRCYVYNRAFARWFDNNNAHQTLADLHVKDQYNGQTRSGGLSPENQNLRVISRFDLIRLWAKDRGLYNDGDPKTQTLKLMEEAGEICRAVLKKDEPEIIDGIGDCVVVLTNLAHLCGTSIEKCIDAAYNEIKDRTGKMSNGTFKKD